MVHYTSLAALVSMLRERAEPGSEEGPAEAMVVSTTTSTTEDDSNGGQKALERTSNANLPELAYGDARNGAERRFLRLYDCANLSDPLEGAYFLKELVGTEDALRVLEYVVQIPAYIASFVTPQHKDQKYACDNLVFWRHYGQEQSTTSCG